MDPCLLRFTVSGTRTGARARRRAADGADDAARAASWARRLSGGTDGDRVCELDVVAPPLVPFLYPERVLRPRRRSGAGRYAAGTKAPRIPRERWPAIATRAEREGLRTVARDLGVSHETVRSLVLALTRAEMAVSRRRSQCSRLAGQAKSS